VNKIDEEMAATTLKHLNQLAMQAIRQENYQYALDTFTKSLVLEEKLGLKAPMAESFYNLATVYYLMEDYQQALHKAQFAHTLFLQENKAEDAAKTQNMLSEIKEKMTGAGESTVNGG
jgi:tetratricopeptide (TPR) repeat protein